MSTATIAAPMNGAGTHAQRQAFSAAVEAKTASTSPVAWLRATTTSARGWIGDIASRLGLGRITSWLRGAIAPRAGAAYRVVQVPGRLNVLGLALTTERSREWLMLRVPSTIYRYAMVPVRLAARGVATVLNRVGGRGVTSWVSTRWASLEAYVADKVFTAHCWVVDREGSQGIRLVRSVFFGAATGRILRRLTTNPYLRVAGYGVIAFTPMSGIAAYDSPAAAILDGALHTVTDKEGQEVATHVDRIPAPAADALSGPSPATMGRQTTRDAQHLQRRAQAPAKRRGKPANHSR